MKGFAIAVVFFWFTLLPLVGYTDDVTDCGKVSGFSIRCLDAPASCVGLSLADVSPAACTRVIESRRYSGHDLASLHFMRGTIYHFGADYDKAIADYNAALRLNPEFVLAHVYRSVAYFYHYAVTSLVKGIDTYLRIRN